MLNPVLNRARQLLADYFEHGLLGYAVAASLAVWLTWGIWPDGPPVGDDTIAHLIRADYAIRNFVLYGRLDGWQPSFALGYQQHLFIGPTLTWLTALIQVASLESMSTLVAFKAVIVLLFALQPLAVGYLAHSFGLSRQAASIAGVLSLLVSSPFGGFGIPGLFGVGLTANLPGAVVFCLAVGAVLRLLVRPSPRRAVQTGLLFALLTVTHGISLILAVTLLVVFLPLALIDMAIWRRISKGRFAQLMGGWCDRQDTRLAPPTAFPTVHQFRLLGVAAVIAAAVAAWVILPIALPRDLRGLITGWGHTPLPMRIVDIWNGHILFDSAVIPWIALGLLYGVWRVLCGRFLALSLICLPFAFLGLGELMTAIDVGNVISMQITNRGLGPAGLLAVFPLAALVATVTRPTGKWSQVVAVAIAATLVIVVMQRHRPNIRPVTPVPQALAAAEQLRKIVPDGARYAMQRDYPDEIRIVGMNHPDFWMAWQSGTDEGDQKQRHRPVSTHARLHGLPCTACSTPATH